MRLRRVVEVRVQLLQHVAQLLGALAGRDQHHRLEVHRETVSGGQMTNFSDATSGNKYVSGSGQGQGGSQQTGEAVLLKTRKKDVLLETNIPVGQALISSIFFSDY